MSWRHVNINTFLISSLLFAIRVVMILMVVCACLCISEKVCAGLLVIKGLVSHEWEWWELFMSPATSNHTDAYATVVVVVSITSLSATGSDSAISLFKVLVIFENDQVSSWYRINISPCLPFPVLLTPFACDAMDPLEENFLPEDSKFPSASSLLFFSFLLLCRAFNCFNLLEKNFVLPVCSPFTSYWKQTRKPERELIKFIHWHFS